MRLEERVNERTRIARDLHDTLLQSFQGVLLKFHAVTYLLTNQPEAEKSLEAVIDQARQAITEGRDTVHGLRSSTVPANDLARALSVLAEELTANQMDGNRADFRVHVEGVPRDLAPIVRDEVYRLGCEALRNAFRQHKHGSNWKSATTGGNFGCACATTARALTPRFSVETDVPDITAYPACTSALDVWAESWLSGVNSIPARRPNSAIPASVAYAKSTARRRLLSFRRGA